MIPGVGSRTRGGVPVVGHVNLVVGPQRRSKRPPRDARITSFAAGVTLLPPDESTASCIANYTEGVSVSMKET